MSDARDTGGVECGTMPVGEVARANAARAPACSTKLPKRLGQALLIVILLGIVGAWAAQSKPGWWRPPTGAVRGGVVAPERAASDDNGIPMNSAQAADDSARALEQGLASEFTRVRPSNEPWAIKVRSADANAWLALRLPQWLAHDRELPWPKGVDLVQICFDAPDRVTLGAERDGWVWSATMRVRLENGRLALEPVGGALGRLWIPWLMPSAPKSPPAAGDAAAGVGSEEGGALSVAAFVPELAESIEAIVPLPDGRRVRLLDFEFDRSEARFRFETLPR